MALALHQIPLVDYIHEFALLPFLERRVTCPDLGGTGNTAIEICRECERYNGTKDSSRWAHVLCRSEAKEKKKKLDRNVGYNGHPGRPKK